MPLGLASTEGLGLSCAAGRALACSLIRRRASSRSARVGRFSFLRGQSQLLQSRQLQARSLPDRQLASHGSVVQAARLRGVHLGTKGSGRSPGRRLGYSQVANPLYLARKGTMRWSLALKHMAKNLLANSVRSLSPEPWVDRRGRLAGNCLAMWDCVRGQVDPQRILRF